MKIYIKNEIAIKGQTMEESEEIKSWLTIANPQHFQNESMGFSNWGVPEKLTLYEFRKSFLYVPAGILPKLIERFNPDVEDMRSYKSNIAYRSDIQLYDYQQNVLDNVTSSGIIVMPAGSGKTETALQLIAKSGRRALWLTHTIDLLNQSYNRAKDKLPGASLGKISAGKATVGDHITFATVQTFIKCDMKQYSDLFDIVIVDECHRITTASQMGMFAYAINSLNAVQKIGITATPYRNMKGTEIAMFALLGDIIAEVDKSVVRTCKAKIRKIDYRYSLPAKCFDKDGRIIFSKALNSLAYDKDRNKHISKLIDDIGDKSILVLSDRLDQLEAIKSLVGRGSMVHGKMVSKKDKELREGIIQAMRDKSERILFASYSLAKEGLDIPCLDCLILATPKKDKATVIQSVGRIERVYEGKTAPVVYDIVDSEGIFTTMWYSRNRIYKANGNIFDK